MPTLSATATQQITTHPLYETALLCTSAILRGHYPDYTVAETPQGLVDALVFMADTPPARGELPHGDLRARVRRVAADLAIPTASRDFLSRCVYGLASTLAGTAEGLPGAPTWPITTGTVQAAIVADPRWADVAPRIALMVDEPDETDPDRLFDALYFLGEYAYDDEPGARTGDDVDAAATLRLDGGYGRDFVGQWYESVGRVLP